MSDNGSAPVLSEPVLNELSVLGWVLAERLYTEWQARQPDWPAWEDLAVVSQESLAMAFSTMLSADVIQVGTQL